MPTNFRPSRREIYDAVVLIARCEPPHTSHITIIEDGALKAKKFLILLGSANQPRTIKNPWTWEERKTMIMDSVNESTRNKLQILPLEDKLYNDQQWVVNVQNLVTTNIQSDNVALIGHYSDESSYYLKMFPQWKSINIDLLDGLHSTEIRNLYFSARSLDQNTVTYISKFEAKMKGRVPAGVLDFLIAFSLTPEYSNLVDEFNFIKTYKSSWANAPYPPSFVTVDAVVVQSGHVLLVRRRSAPGKGTLALPGGYVGQKETIEDAAIRELREETRLKVPVPVLKGNIRAKEVFDHPGRSLRGRTITHVFLIELSPGPLPPVKGRDDAERAKWVPIAIFEKMLRSQMFEDHWDIVTHMISRL